MALTLTLISLVLAYFSPAELLPGLAPYHIQQIILVPAIAISLVGMTMRGTRTQPLQNILMIGLWFAVVMSFMSKLSLRASLNSFLDFVPLVAIYFLVNINAFTVKRVRLLAGTIAVCGVILAFQAILAYHTGYMATKLMQPIMQQGFTVGWRVQGFGVLNDPNDFAQFLIVSLALLGLFWQKHSIKMAFLAVPVVILGYGVYLTSSRGAIFGLVVIVVVIAGTRLGNLQTLILGVVCLAILIAAHFGGGRAITFADSSAAGRVMAWGTGIAMLKKNPIFGIGFGQFTEMHELTAHNSFVLCFAELGSFGYFFWLAMIVATVLGLQALARTPVKTPEDIVLRRTVTSLRAALYSFLVTGWFLSRTYNLTLYVLLGLATALIYLKRDIYPQIATATRRWIPVTVVFEVVSIVLTYISIRARSFGM